MNCEEFAFWLANRENVDYSLTEDAMKHAVQCENCKKKLDPENAGDALLLAALEKRQDAGQMMKEMDFVFSMDRQPISRTRYRMYGILGAVVSILVIFGLCALFAL